GHGRCCRCDSGVRWRATVSSFVSLDIPPGLAPCVKQVAEASQGRSLSLSRCGAGRCPLPTASIETEVSLRQGTVRELVEKEAEDARCAVPALADDAVAAALRHAAALVRERRAALLAASAADVEAAASSLDEGLLDRLRLDDSRIAALADQV